MNASRLLCAAAAFALATLSATADDTTITIYSTAQPGAIPPEMYRPLPPSAGYNPWQGQQIPGYAMVRQDRTIDLDRGKSTLRFTDVAAHIDPTTVTFTSLTDPDGTSVLEQSYQFDLVSNDKLLERFVGQEVTIEQLQGDTIHEITGTLLTPGSPLVLQADDGSIQTVGSYTNIRFPQLPDGLITKPTLIWDVNAATGGGHNTRVSYQTTSITWWTDYNLIFTPGDTANDGTLDIGAWVSIINKSGATYEDAKLKLIAGDVHRAPQPSRNGMREMEMMARSVEDTGGFEEKSFFEYHLYTLGRPTTLPENSTKQIELFPMAMGVPVEKIMVYYGGPTYHGYYRNAMTDRNFGNQSNTKVDVYLRFRNDEEHGMGMPLPSGRIRVNQRDSADGSLEFIGEDVIDHTPKNENVLVKMGSAFDIVGERTQTDFKIDTNRKTMEETFKISIRNHKEGPVEVVVKEVLYRWSQWEITAKSNDFEKIDAQTIHFPMTIPTNGEETITYTVRYTW